MKKENPIGAVPSSPTVVQQRKGPIVEQLSEKELGTSTVDKQGRLLSEAARGDPRDPDLEPLNSSLLGTVCVLCTNIMRSSFTSRVVNL